MCTPLGPIGTIEKYRDEKRIRNILFNVWGIKKSNILVPVLDG